MFIYCGKTSSDRNLENVVRKSGAMCGYTTTEFFLFCEQESEDIWFVIFSLKKSWHHFKMSKYKLRSRRTTNGHIKVFSNRRDQISHLNLVKSYYDYYDCDMIQDSWDRLFLRHNLHFHDNVTFVPNKHVFLHLQNKIYRPGHLCSTSVLHYNVSVFAQVWWILVR